MKTFGGAPLLTANGAGAVLITHGTPFSERRGRLLLPVLLPSPQAGQLPPRRAIKTLVLDEADEMLSKGFKEQIYDVYRYLPPETQVGGVVRLGSERGHGLLPVGALPALGAARRGWLAGRCWVARAPSWLRGGRHAVLCCAAYAWPPRCFLAELPSGRLRLDVSSLNA